MANQGDVERGGRHLVLIQSVLSAIPLFYFSVFKVPVGVEKQLEGLMRLFLWKGTTLRQGRCLAMVSRDVVCRPIKQGGFGILHVQSMNTALLTKWVTRILAPEMT